MKAFLRIAVILTGVLALAVALLVLGRVDTTAQPSADFYGPSGLSAFADLLRGRGFRVRSDRVVDPRIAQDELAIAISTRDYNPIMEGSMPRPNPDLDSLEATLDSFIRDGGSLLTSQVNERFQASASAAQPKLVQKAMPDGNVDQSGDIAHISAVYTSSPHFAVFGRDARPVFMSDGRAFVSVHVHDKGVAMSILDGMGMTNRFIDQQDNAKFMVSMVEAMAPGKKVVFLEAAHGDIVRPGLLESLGVWLKYGWTQFMFLGLVIAYSLGKRFGLPIMDPFTQRGQRDLVDAVASLYQRARADETAIHSVLRNADRDIRKSLKLSFDAPVAQRNDQIPDRLRLALEHAERVASIPESPQAQVLSAASKVEREVAQFIQSRTIIRAKAKRKAA